MKRLLLIPFILLFISCGLTKYTHESQTETVVVDIPNKSKNDIYVKANKWMVSIFSDAKSVIQFSDKESGVISGKYLVSALYPGEEGVNPKYLYAIINIEVKENKARLKITPDDFIYVPNNPYSLYNPEKLENDIDALFLSFKEYMLKEENKDW